MTSAERPVPAGAPFFWRGRWRHTTRLAKSPRRAAAARANGRRGGRPRQVDELELVLFERGLDEFMEAVAGVRGNRRLRALLERLGGHIVEIQRG